MPSNVEKHRLPLLSGRIGCVAGPPLAGNLTMGITQSGLRPLLFLLVTPVAPATHPAPAGSNPFGAGRRRRGQRQIGQTDTLSFAAVLTHGFEATIIVHLDGEYRPRPGG